MRSARWLFRAIRTTLDCATSVPPSEPVPPDLCGNCPLCLDACPTDALVEPYVIDARRCISYLTIELRGIIPEELRPGMGGKSSAATSARTFARESKCARFRFGTTYAARHFLVGGREFRGADASASLFAPPLEWLASLTEEDFHLMFRGSPVRRTKWRGLVRNACVALGNSGVEVGDPARAGITALLVRLADSYENSSQSMPARLLIA